MYELLDFLHQKQKWRILFVIYSRYAKKFGNEARKLVAASIQHYIKTELFLASLAWTKLMKIDGKFV